MIMMCLCQECNWICVWFLSGFRRGRFWDGPEILERVHRRVWKAIGVQVSPVIKINIIITNIVSSNSNFLIITIGINPLVNAINVKFFSQNIIFSSQILQVLDLCEGGEGQLFSERRQSWDCEETKTCVWIHIKGTGSIIMKKPNWPWLSEKFSKVSFKSPAEVASKCTYLISSWYSGMQPA